MTEITYRPPAPSELADCALVWHGAVDDYMGRLGRELPPPVLDPLVTLLEHVFATDPERFLVAVRRDSRRREQVVGFGIAVQREHVWFLSQLYVLPDFQGGGIGRSLLTRILPSLPADDGATDDGPPGVLATCTDSVQPISNALYSRFGIVPRLPVFNLVGRPRPDGAMAGMPSDVSIEPLDAAPAAGATASGAGDNAEIVASIDRAVLGYAHPADHRHLRETGRFGFLYRAADGSPLGYGYTSLVGRLGPIALLDETLTAGVLMHLLTVVEPRGATSVWVPGANDRAVVALLRAGLQIEGFPALLCWTRPFSAFDRYVPSGLALL